MGNLYNFFQNQVFPQRTLAICLILLLSFFSETVLAQTPGLIIRKGNVTGGAPSATVLNPSGSGWTSTSTSGFVSNDITESEIAYQPVPTPAGTDPEGDLRRGSTGGFSEIVSGPSDSGLFFFSDGTNLLFRLRIAGLVAGSKGYSVLIDSDGKFGNSGPNADPNWTASNPGFEYEIIYESNFRVAIYNIDGGTTPTLVNSYDLNDLTPGGGSEHAQISVALPYSSSPPDYFYDWYVPISAFAAEAPAIAITDSSPLRMVATTVMAPKPAINGPASDIQGDDTEFKNPLDQWSNIINAQSGTAPDGSTGPNLLCTAPTRITGPIAPDVSSISGMWTSSSSVTTATIEVFRIRAAVTDLLGTTSATSAATWTLSGLPVGEVADGDVIYATAQGTGEGICGQSNSVLVQDCNTETTTGVPSITAFTNSGATGTKTLGTTLRIYRVNADGTRTLLASGREGETTWGWAGDEIVLTNPASPNPSSSGGTRTPSGTYVVTQQAPGECESIGVFSACITGVGGAIIQTAQPVITQATITEESTTLSGTAASGSTVRLFISGIQVATATATGGNYSFSLGSYFLQSGQTVSVRAQTTGECLSAADTRTVVLSPVFCDLSSPFISNNGDGQIQAGSAISGVSSEAVGTEITVYNASTNAVIGTTTVIAGGTWSLAGPAVAGTTYFARHFTTACGFSNPSNTVTALAASTASCGTITGPVLQTATFVAGTGYSPASTVRLFIDGAEIGDATVDIDGEWEIPVSPSGPNAIYPGGVLTTTVENVGQLPLSCPSSVTVDCVPHAVPLISTSTPIATSASSFSVTISNSVTGVLYYIVDDQTDVGLGQTLGTQRGTSLFGNGGALVLTSSTFMSAAGTYRFKVITNPLSGASCNSESAQFDVNKTVAVNILVNDIGVTYLNTALSGNVATNDVTSGTIAYSNATGALAGATLTMNSDGSYSFTATAAGVYSYSINVCTSPATPPACPTTNLTITVTDPASTTNPPVANTDSYVVLQAATLNGNVLTNDILLSGTMLTVTQLNGVPGDVGAAQANYGGSGGMLTLNANGTFSLVNPTIPGAYSFTYQVCDNATIQGCATATVYFTVYATGSANTVIVADDYANGIQGAALSGNLLTNDTQLVGTTPLSVVGGPTVLTDANGNSLAIAANGAYTFTPNSVFTGATSFVYEAEGTDGASAFGTAYFTVAPFLVNPDIDVAFINVAETGNLSTNDQVITGSTYALDAVVSVPGGAAITFTINPNGTYSFLTDTPGIYVYDVEVCAPAPLSLCTVERFTITVTDPALATNAPVANTDLAITEAGTAVVINVLANDKTGVPGVSGKALGTTPSSISAPSNGAAVLSGNNIQYTPNPGFTGTDSFTYQICDAASVCSTATVFVDVYPSGAANVVTAVDDYVVTNGIAPASGNVLSNDTQLSGGAAFGSTVTLVGPATVPGVGTLVLNADGSYTFTAVSGFEGNASFVYSVTGTGGATASATLHISVYPPLTFTWTGDTDDNWCDVTNWVGGVVPTTGVNVTIPSTANDPVFDVSTCPVCINDLTIASGVIVGLTGKLCVTGDLDSQGNVVGAGSISLEGTTPQTITGQFNINNLELNNSTGAVITSGVGNMVNITESLILTLGSLTTNDNLRLISDINGDAYIAPITGLACGPPALVSIIGNVRVQKFVDGGNRAFRFIAHPFDGTLSLQQVRDYVHITGSGLDFNSTGNPSAFWYVTASGNQAEEGDDTGWVPVSSTNIGEWFKGPCGKDVIQRASYPRRRSWR
jgi:large repetitive protein